MLTASPKSTTRSRVETPAIIGGEFSLDPLTLGDLPHMAGWRGVPDWETPQATYLASGRMALVWGLQAYGAEPGPIWVPEYICHSVVQTLRRAGWIPRPYPLRDDLSADLDAWARVWDGGPTACLLMHYFGFPQPAAVWEFLAERTARPLVEDRTHSLWNADSTQADVMFASLRKWVALPDGGVVRVRRARSKPSMADSDAQFVRRRLMALTARHTFFDGKRDDSTSEAYFLDMIERSERQLDDHEAIRAMSHLSWRLLQTYSIPELVARRRSNYERLATALQGHPRVRLLFGTLPAGASPIGCPILCERRDELRARLKAERIYCAVHWPLESWAEDWATPHALTLSRRLLTLNVDQRMESEDVDRLAEAIWSHGV